MRILITIIIILVIFCILRYDCQDKENFAEPIGVTKTYQHNRENLNIKNFTSYFLQQQDTPIEDTEEETYEKIKAGIIDLHFRFLSKFYSTNGNLLTTYSVDSSIQKDEILITNLGMIQAVGELRKAQKIKSKDVPPESNNSELDKPQLIELMPGKKKLNDFLNESIDNILNNYVVIFKNQNFFEYDNQMYFKIADTSGNLLFSYDFTYPDDGAAPDTLDRNTIQVITENFSEKMKNTYKLLYLKQDLDEKTMENIMDINFEINFNSDTKIISYSWNMTYKVIDTTEVDIVQEQIKNEIRQLNMGEPGPGYMMSLEGVTEVDTEHYSILKNNLSHVKKLCYTKQNEIMDNVFLDCESNLNNLDIIFKYLTNYETIKNTIENPGVELKLKNITNLVEDYYLYISIYYNLFYNRYREDIHKKILKLMVSVYRDIQVYNTKLFSTNTSNNSAGTMTDTMDSQSELSLKLNKDSIEVLTYDMDSSVIPETFKSNLKGIVKKYQAADKILGNLFTIIDKPKPPAASGYAGGSDYVEGSEYTNDYQRDSFKIQIRKGQLESTEKPLQEIKERINALIRTIPP